MENKRTNIKYLTSDLSRRISYAEQANFSKSMLDLLLTSVQLRKKRHIKLKHTNSNMDYELFRKMNADGTNTIIL